MESSGKENTVDRQMLVVLASGLHAQRTKKGREVARRLAPKVNEEFARLGATPCDKHDLTYCAPCYLGITDPQITGDRTASGPSYGHDTHGVALIDQPIAGWDTTLIRGR